MKIQPIFTAIIACFLFINTGAQNLNSIYSAYGIGDVNIRDWNAYTSMGGLGIALKSERTLNDLNPASYGGLQHYRYLMELSTAGTSVNYVSEHNTISGGDFNIKRFAFGMNLFKNLGTVFGVRQFSNVDYSSTAYRNIAGTNTSLQEDINGTGGLHLVYLGNGYNIGKHLSLGITTGILFGSINKKELMYLPDGSGINIEGNSFYNQFYVNTGLQYQFKTGTLKWTIGATFQPAMKLKNETINQIKDLQDTVLVSAATTHTKFSYPLQYGAGITVSKGGSKLGIDYIRQNWGSTGYKGASFTTTNQQNIAAGYSYTFYKSSAYGPVERVSLMAGFQKDLSYIVINKQQVSAVAGTAGVNFPGKRGLFNYTLGLRAGQRGTVNYPLVKEKFVDFTFNISLGDFFYTGRKKYD